MLSRVFRQFILLGVASASFALPAAEPASPISLRPAQAGALGLETLKVQADQAMSGARLPARVDVPNEQMRLVVAPVPGRVDALLVAPGASVKRGQVVARLLSPQALELQRDVLQSGSHLALQQQNLKRDEQLFAEGLIPESRIQATRAVAAQAEALAGERRQGLQLAGIAPGKLGGALALTSPLDGVVLEQGVQVGQRVDSAELVYRIARLSPLWLEIQAPLAVAEGLKPGMSVRINGTDVQGKLAAVGRSVDATSQTVLLRAVVSDGADKLRPGQAVEISVVTPGASGYRLPAAAVARHDGKTLVFVEMKAEGDNRRFEAREVRVSSQAGDSVVVEGVKTGETVAVKGVSGLKAVLAGVGRE